MGVERSRTKAISTSDTQHALSRRAFLAGTMATAFGAAGFAQDAPQQASTDQKAYDFALEPLGKLEPVPSRQIKASPLSVGFEVLDRKRFDPTRTYDLLGNLGVKWARCQTGWNRCERSKGQYTFEWLDAVVDSLLEIGIQPWFNLGYGNRLYTPAKPDDTSVGWAPVFNDAAQSAWLRFVDKLAEHFADRVKHWEIWNEPNITSFWKPNKPNAEDYVTMVRVTAPRIRQRVDDATIIGGAFAGIHMPYIEGCLEAGLADLVDRISYHPYRPVPEAGYESEIAQLRKLVAQRNPKVQLWQGENGCPSKGGPGSVGAMSNLDWNELRQAKWLLRRILGDLRLELELTSYFHTVDLVGYRGATNFKGLLRGNEYTPKPAYFAYQSLCALFDAQTKKIDGVPELVDAQRVRLQDAMFLRNGHLIYAWWYPADLLKPWEPRTITVSTKLPAGVRFDQPVLVDPLTQKIYSFPRAERRDDRVVLRDLPMLDYPLLVMDRELVMKKS